MILSLLPHASLSAAPDLSAIYTDMEMCSVLTGKEERATDEQQPLLGVHRAKKQRNCEGVGKVRTTIDASDDHCRQRPLQMVTTVKDKQARGTGRTGYKAGGTFGKYV